MKCRSRLRWVDAAGPRYLKYDRLLQRELRRVARLARSLLKSRRGQRERFLTCLEVTRSASGPVDPRGFLGGLVSRCRRNERPSPHSRSGRPPSVRSAACTRSRNKLQTSDYRPSHGTRHYEPAAIETGTAIAGSVLARRALFLTLLVTRNRNDSPNKPESNARMTYVPPMSAMSR